MPGLTPPSPTIQGHPVPPERLGMLKAFTGDATSTSDLTAGLEEDGYLSAEQVWPNYRSLWRAQRSCS